MDQRVLLGSGGDRVAIVHPIERLRYVARARGAEPSVLVWEAARALMSVVGDDPVALVTGCRRLVERHPSCGPMWWLASRVLVSTEPFAEARTAADELEADPTGDLLALDLPEDTTVTVVGWPEQAATALRRRGDLEVLVVDASFSVGRGRGWDDPDDDDEVVAVPASGLGAAVAESGLVLVEALALGPDAFIAQAGSRAAAAVARHAGIPVWCVAGAGRVLPGRLWEALVARVVDVDEPWTADVELVPLDLVDAVAGPGGRTSPADAARRADCPIAPELLKRGTA